MTRETLRQVEEEARAGSIIMWIWDAAGLLGVKTFPDSVNAIQDIETYSRTVYAAGRHFRAVHHGREIWKSFC